MNNDDPEQSESLFRDLQNFIACEASGSFEELALRLFTRHYRLNAPYRTYCDSLGVSPAEAQDWTSIPAVPARAFKTLQLSCCDVEESAAVFHSSGTTEGQSSKNYLDRNGLKLYEQSLRAGFMRVCPNGPALLALMQDPGEAPHSSLSYMLGALGATRYFWTDRDRDRLSADLDSSERSEEPVCVFATAFALLDFFDNAPERRWHLPAGSRVVETGGFKGRARQVEREELYGLIAAHFGVEPPAAFAEYGMSEMASQYYSDAAHEFRGGHWARARIIDPFTDRDAEQGILRHYDLANWNSVAAIQTQDLGERAHTGAFRLLGRAADAEPRGCSLSMEERWQQAAAAH